MKTLILALILTSASAFAQSTVKTIILPKPAPAPKATAVKPVTLPKLTVPAPVPVTIKPISLPRLAKK